MICRDGHGHPSAACDYGIKPVTRQPCSGQTCDEPNEDVRQKKTADRVDQNTNNQVGSGWLKLDSGILKPPTIIEANTENTAGNTSDIMESEITTMKSTTTARIPSEPT